MLELLAQNGDWVFYIKGERVTESMSSEEAIKFLRGNNERNQQDTG